MSTTALYPGSFDPPTFGHLDIIGRAARIFDTVIIAVGSHHTKTALLPLDRRVSLLEAEVAALNIQNVTYTTFGGLVVDAAREHGAGVIVRGLRNTTDYDYEVQMAAMNATLADEVETVFLNASPKTDFIASSLVKQIARMGGDISSFVPALTMQKIVEQLKT
jgi:pantetheine-phosphate adenylyltransferase